MLTNYILHPYPSCPLTQIQIMQLPLNGAEWYNFVQNWFILIKFTMKIKALGLFSFLLVLYAWWHSSSFANIETENDFGHADTGSLLSDKNEKDNQRTSDKSKLGRGRIKLHRSNMPMPDVCTSKFWSFSFHFLIYRHKGRLTNISQLKFRCTCQPSFIVETTINVEIVSYNWLTITSGICQRMRGLPGGYLPYQREVFSAHLIVLVVRVGQVSDRCSATL